MTAVLAKGIQDLVEENQQLKDTLNDVLARLAKLEAK